jgi:hypothetical protein
MLHRRTAILFLLTCVIAEAEKKRADAAARQAVDEAIRAQFQTALTSFQQGWSRAEQGDVAEGMLWMLEALERTPETHLDFRSLVRADLPAWEQQLVRMKYRIAYEAGTSHFSYSPDGQTVLVRLPDGISLQSRDAATGRPAPACCGYISAFPSSIAPPAPRLSCRERNAFARSASRTGCGDLMGCTRAFVSAVVTPVVRWKSKRAQCLWDRP